MFSNQAECEQKIGIRIHGCGCIGPRLRRGKIFLGTHISTRTHGFEHKFFRDGTHGCEGECQIFLDAAPIGAQVVGTAPMGAALVGVALVDSPPN